MLSALPASDPFSAWDGPDFLGFKPVTSSSGLDDPNRARATEKPDSDKSNRVASVVEERKRRRMLSNRESARRSRMRKQRHVENLRNLVNLSRVENRELNNGLQFLLHHCNRLRTENDWLRSQRTLLRQKLAKINQILVFQQLQRSFSSAWPCNILTVE